MRKQTVMIERTCKSKDCGTAWRISRQEAKEKPGRLLGSGRFFQPVQTDAILRQQSIQARNERVVANATCPGCGTTGHYKERPVRVKL